ncbi:chitin synthesis regulation, resistance to congo red-domain-containing protein [Pseudoneurospora amorphoporcata]|uniref:Chitin synthesis regulation, resistance to congo red-domain-containing protein n=1 Tax=Pseudoneurospora amorphoporcata TaxID=241081 RepID=A0AAN6P3F6_9PEZI|nr:chitin synthesis regulation, resistance to congo red-domain-containing protein [Pseudoneurospora amorphoporcata]
MAPLAEMANQVHAMAKRARCDCDSYGNCYCYSAWYYYGRWILLGICILCVFLSVFLMARRNSRRRRMHGAVPMYGTGWMAPAPPPYAPPPQYSAQPPPGSQGGYYAPNGNGPKPEQNGPGAYYPNQQGVQLQQPASAYHRGPDEQFTPPEGPPPSQARRYQ